MFQKDFPEHEASCEFKPKRCDKCEAIKEATVEHDCMKSMSKKSDMMQDKLGLLSRKLDLYIERDAKNCLVDEKGT